MTRKQVGLSLFWRTYFLLLLLLSLVVAGWVWTMRTQVAPPATVQALSTQLSGTVQLVRDTALRFEPAERAGYLRSLAQRSHLMLQPRIASDLWQPLTDTPWSDGLAAALRQQLGADVTLAANLNGQGGLWLGLSLGQESWWLRSELGVPPPLLTSDALLWLGAALMATLLISALIAQRINQPLRDLSFAASKIRGGEFDSRLDESHSTSEIREVNRGFNHMARELARVEEDRAVMLAGISHDLRTPLARLRLEAEMSVTDDEALANMASDIDQLDAIIDKFMDYARPGETHLKPVLLGRLVDKEAAAFRDPSEIQISSKVAIDVRVYADEVELGRVFANLFENARRYGRNINTGIAQVQVSYVRTGAWVVCSVRDSGSGVPAEKLQQLTTPFFRGDAARTAATGAGLGLAIVEKAMQRMGGQVEIANAPEGGLLVHLRLKYAKT